MAKLSTRRYALVLLDIDLPVMSGYALASWYKDYCRREKVQRAYVMALTADPHVEQCREFGMDWCYPKPLTFALVEVLARQWLAGIGPSPTPSPMQLPKAGDLPSSAHSLPVMLPPPHAASRQAGHEAGRAPQPGALSTGVLPYSPTRTASGASQTTPPRAARGASQSQLTPRMAAMDVSEAAAPAAMDEGRDGA